MSTRAQAPLVSILIPVYNREKLIVPCIESACAQTIADLEIIVCDNCSTDGTLAVCRELAARDPRIRVFSNDSNLGPVRNWQRCIAEARGSFGKILFSDDLMAPDYLEKALPYLKDDRVGFVFSPVVVGPEPFQGNLEYQFTRQTGSFPSSRFISTALYNGDVPLSPGAAIFRLKDLKENLLTEIPSPTVKDFPRHGAGPDLLIYLLTASRYPQVAYLHEPLSYFRAHPGSITLSKEKVYLMQCYRQARLWFAQSYLSEGWFKRLYVYQWKRERRETKRPISLASMVGLYSEKKVVISPLDVASSALTAKLVKKGRLVLQRSAAGKKETA